MKKNIISIILHLLFVVGNAQEDYLFFPRYKEVVKAYFENYSVKNKPENSLMKFEKRPDGWHIVINEYDNKTIQKECLIWSLKTKAFENISFIKKNETESYDEEYLTFLNNWEGIHYDVSPYFGYEGFDWDIIQKYVNFDVLPDTVLYGIGRAYSSFASNLLNDNTGTSDSTHRFNLSDGQNALNVEQLQKYHFYRYKAIEIFKKVKALNPNFETLVGSIGLKLSHEYLTAFLDLREYQNEEEALKELPENVYSEFYVSLAKNYLSSCEKNAILFVNGDTDTYTLLYVQAKYKFRADVTVINAGLLLTKRYVDHLRYKTGENDGLQFSLCADAMKDKKREVIYFQNDSSKVWKIKKAIDYLNNEKNITKMENEDYFILDGAIFNTKINNKSITWQLTRRGYMIRDELMMLDIILNYGRKRPIYFSQTLTKDKYLGLNNYLGLEGLAYKLGNSKNELTSSDGYINTDIFYNNLMEKFYWDGNDKVQILDKPLVNNYAYQFGWLVYKLIEEKKQQKAKEVLDKYFAVFQDKHFPFDNSVIFLMQSYYNLGEISKANDIGKSVIQNINNHRINKASLFDQSSEIELNESAISKIKEIAKIYNQEDFYNKLLN